MRPAALGLALAALAGCASPGFTRPIPGALVTPGDAATIIVLPTAPAGAVVLGDVRGVEWRGSALDDARRRAATLGADAIVITGTGEQGTGFSPHVLPFVDAIALRVRTR